MRRATPARRASRPPSAVWPCGSRWSGAGRTAAPRAPGDRPAPTLRGGRGGEREEAARANRRPKAPSYSRSRRAASRSSHRERENGGPRPESGQRQTGARPASVAQPRPRISRSRIGVVMNVVTSAMITSIVNSRGEIAPDVEADVEHDQLDEAARVHQDAERRRLAPAEAGEARGDERAAELADRRDRHDDGAQRPVLPRSSSARSRCACR